MAPKDLTTDEMLSLCDAWLDPARHKPVFEASLVLAPLLPSISIARERLAALSAPSPAAATDLLELTQQASETDQLYDRKGRGIFQLLESLQSLAHTPEDAAEYAWLRAQLFPAGLHILTQSHVAEASHAHRVEKVLRNPDAYAALASIPLPAGRNLVDAVQEFVTAGHKLGELEARKAAAQAQGDAVVGEVAPSAVISARNLFTRVANALVGSSSLLDSNSPALRALLDEYFATERESQRRAAPRTRVAIE